MSQTPATQGLTQNQVSQAIAMISGAFYHDPFSVYLYPDEEERTRRLPLLWSIPVRYCARSGDVTTTADLSGAACWLPPDEKGIGVAYLLRSGILSAALRMGTRATTHGQGSGLFDTGASAVHERAALVPLDPGR